MRAVINVSTRKYHNGLYRLRQTIQDNSPQTIFLYFTREYQIGAPFHTNSMYAFKPYAFREAMEQGFTTVLWLDASMYVRKDLTPIFEQIERDGYYGQDSGWENSRWTTPEQKEYFGTDKGKMISSGVIGLDLTNPIGIEFLNRWIKASDDGMFNGSHDVTRHDQTSASLIIEQMGLKITPNETHWMYGNPSDNFKENILIVANGIV